MKKSTFLTFALVVSWFSAWTQCMPMRVDYLTGNRVKATITNGGDFFWDLASMPGYQVPADSFYNIGLQSSFATGLWLGALDEGGELHTAGAMYRQSGQDYFAGPVRDHGVYDCDQNPILFSSAHLFKRRLELSNGDYFILYQNGYEIFDGQAHTTTQYYTNLSWYYTPAELSGNRLLLIPMDLAQDSLVVLDLNTHTWQKTIIAPCIHNPRKALSLPGDRVLYPSTGAWTLYDHQNQTLTSTHYTGSGLYDPAIVLPDGNVFTGNRVYNVQADSMENINVSQATIGGNNLKMQLLANGKVFMAVEDSFGLYDPLSRTVQAFPYPFTPIHNITFNWPSEYSLQSITGIGNEVWVLFEQFLIKADGNTGACVLYPIVDAGNLIFSTLNSIFLIQDNRIIPWNHIQDRFTQEPWQRIWHADASEIQAYTQAYSAGNLNPGQYPDITGWPAQGDVQETESQQLAPFQDMNANGVYEPLQGEVPCLPGHYNRWTVFHDDGVHTETNGPALKVEVELTAYSYNQAGTSCPDSALDYTTFYHMEITNRSGQDYHDFYAGLFWDVDIGYYLDDYVGSDSTLGLAYAYNGDANDNGFPGYGLNPPALGVLGLNATAPLTGAMYYENDFTLHGNPEDAIHFYNYLRGRWKTGQPMQYAGTGAPTRWVYTGDPGCGGAATGWTESISGNQPFDRRLLPSFGPLSLPAGETISLDYALVWSRSTANANIGSVCSLKQSAAAIKSWWQAQTFPCFTANPVAAATPVSAAPLHVSPNPSQGHFRLEVPGMVQPGSLEILGLMGQTVHTQSLAATDIHDIHAADLPAGMYLLRVRTGADVRTTQLIVME